MKKVKLKLLLLLISIFLFLNILSLSIVESSKNDKIQIALKENLDDLQTHYQILLYHQSSLADAVHLETVTLIKNFTNIMTKAVTASEQDKDLLRQELYNLLINKYKILKMQGILQYHFVLPNNESFLRMHKPSKYGDNLTKIREDFRLTNKNKVVIKAFTQGRTAHGFRNTYPLFAKDGTHIGAMEISFSSDSLQKYLTNISRIHTHFLVDKSIFDANAWQRNDLILKYRQSAENQNFMITMNKAHTVAKCIDEVNYKFKDKKEKIAQGIKTKKRFAVYTKVNSNYTLVASYLPVLNIKKDKALAWIVSYEKSPFINDTIQTSNNIIILFALGSLILLYLIYTLALTRQKVLYEHKLVNDVLNSTDDIMFATNFKTISFSNRKFRDFFSVADTTEFNKNKNILDLFEAKDGYLHKDLLNKSQTFTTLILETKKENRVVGLVNKHFILKSFNITLTETSDTEDKSYLVTLTDITEMKEKERKIQKKAYTDGLTGVFNRNKFDEILEQEFYRNIRYKRNLSIAIIDIDNFKIFNDTFGHLVGDEVLIMLAKNLASSIRDADTFARWGGEEFVILFPETSKEDARLICDKLRNDIEKLSHKEAGGITASFGVAQYQKNDTIDSFFNRCDKALYEAKNLGRNRVVVK